MAAAARQDAAPAGELMDESAGWLDADWVVLPAEALPGLPGEPRTGERRFVLLHPAHGIVILDLWSSVAALPELEVAASLDTELALAGFLRRLDPRLPVRRIYLAQAALPQLTGVVARAHAGAPPLELPEGWIDAVRGRLAVPQQPAGLAARRMPRLRMAGRYRLVAGIAALVTVGAVGLLAAGGDVVGQRAQPAAAEASAPGSTAPATTLAIAVPEPAPAEPALSPAPPLQAASAGPLAARAAVAPPAAVEPPPDPARVAAAPAPLEPARSPAPPPPAASAGPLAASTAIAPPPAAAESVPAVQPDPARAAAATAEEDTTDGPVATPPRPVRRQARPVRRAAPARYSQGRVLNSSGSFIRQQSQQYATGNGG